MSKPMSATMSEHAPGPWEASGSSVVEDKRGRIVASCQFNGGDDDEECANAALIAAAPEMLAALKVVSRLHQISEPHRADLCHICTGVDSAIAKAEGQP